MNNKWLWSCGVLIVLTASMCMPLQAAPMTIVVAPGGDDANAGTPESPLATLQAAQEKVQAYCQSGLKSDVQVLLRGGIYHLNDPLVLTPADGGNHEFAVTYAAWPGEKPVLSGGRPITDWTAGEDNMWTAVLPDVKSGKWWFRQLYADGQRLSRGRYPESGFLKIKERSDDFMSLKLSQVLPGDNMGGQDTEVVVIENWSIAREIITSSKEDTVTAATPIGWLGHGACLPKPGMSVFLEHALEFVTQPDQWYLGRGTGILHYKAQAGENPNQKKFAAPVLEQIVVIKGSKEEPVRNLHFKGIQFAHTAFNMPKIGYAGIQACYYGTTVATGGEDQVTYSVPPAVELEYTQDCSIKDCLFEHMGANSVALGAGCRRNQIVGCEFADVGANGPMVGYMKIRAPLHTDWKDLTDAPINNEISNCYIHDCGVELYGAVGIFDAMANGTRIVHNELTRLPYGGISIGYVWNTEWTSQRNCLVAYNHIYDVMERLYDSGAVYTLGFQPGTVIRGNLLHGVKRSGYAFGQAGNNGIFFDEGSKEMLLEDNVIYDIADQPIRYNRNQKDWHLWRGNTFNITPDDPKFPSKIAENAGLETDYQNLLKQAVVKK